MQGNRVFDQDECIVPDHTSAQTRGNPGRAVIVELTGPGTRIREAPPDVLVMVAEQKEITTAGRRAVAAGGSGEVLSSDNDDKNNGTEVHQIRVKFPG